MGGIALQAEGCRVPAARPQTSHRNQPRDARRESAVRMHCPYYQHNPYYKGHSDACVGRGFKTPSRLKEHLKRVHYKNSGLDPQGSDIASPRGSKSNPEQLSETQYSDISKLGRSTQVYTLLHIWQDIYQILFPNERIPDAFKPSSQSLQAAADNPSDGLISALATRMAADKTNLQQPMQELEASARSFLAHLAAELDENRATYSSSASLRSRRLEDHGLEDRRPPAPQGGGIDQSLVSASTNQEPSTDWPEPSVRHPLSEISFQDGPDSDLSYTNSASDWLSYDSAEVSGDSIVFGEHV